MTDEIVSYKGRFCEKHSDFIWGDFIDEKVIEGLYYFWHNQNFLEFHEGQVYTGGDTYVDKDYKESTDLHIPVNLRIPEIQNYMLALQGLSLIHI